ncbi:MAG TPA: M48 family metallopeptidase [Spirochaetia bacterium]|nr:M48 family metallopeptidase [Spirochaetia bacterium]
MSISQPPDGPGPLPVSPGPRRRTRRGVLRDILVLAAAAVVLAAAAFGAQRLLVPRPLPPGDLAAKLDHGLGSVMREQIRTTRAVVDVPVAQDDLERIVSRLRDSLPDPRPDFDVMIVQTPEVNAFTMPGDTICVNTGLLRALGSADQLAGVLGHEMSHAVHRDPLTMLARNLGVATLLSVISGGQGGAVLANMAETLVDMHYGREAEDRADDFSVRLLAKAGIPPEAFADALQRIKDTAKKEPGLLKYLDPHSPIDQRIERARSLARKQAVKPVPLGVDWPRLVKALPGK